MNEKRGGMKKYQTKIVDKTVETMPPTNPPICALKKTAGKKKNQTYGWTYSHSKNWAKRKNNGMPVATNKGKNLFSFTHANIEGCTSIALYHLKR